MHHTRHTPNLEEQSLTLFEVLISDTVDTVDLTVAISESDPKIKI